MEKKNILLLIFLAAIFTAAGFAAGRFSAQHHEEQPSTTKNDNNESDKIIERRSGGYHYINPLWECDNFNPSKLNSIIQLRKDVNDYVEQVLNEKKAAKISVYFRDLNSGPWMGINEKEDFSPASLLKVPILIATLKKCESEPALLQNKIVYTVPRNDAVDPNIVDTSALIKPGHAYPVIDLLNRMIENSDNQAKELLLNIIGDELFAKVMKDIGINIQGVRAGDDFISVKDYSSFFRLLYNATYLNKEMSELALQILSKTTFNDGIKGGLPKDLIVSHKFGERALSDSNMRQLHDCGIIYRPGSPYLLCVMTRGTDFKQLASIIAGVSEIVYKDTYNLQ